MSTTPENSRSPWRLSGSIVTITLLAAALIVTNAWWTYKAVDSGVTAHYREVSFQEHRQALEQALAVLPVAARPESTPADVVSAAQAAYGGDTTFEKEGFLWVGRLGLRFDELGRLVEAVPTWAPF